MCIYTTTRCSCVYCTVLHEHPWALHISPWICKAGGLIWIAGRLWCDVVVTGIHVEKKQQTLSCFRKLETWISHWKHIAVWNNLIHVNLSQYIISDDRGGLLRCPRNWRFHSIGIIGMIVWSCSHRSRGITCEAEYAKSAIYIPYINSVENTYIHYVCWNTRFELTFSHTIISDPLTCFSQHNRARKVNTAYIHFTTVLHSIYIYMLRPDLKPIARL